jgi:hypothetical protein
MTVKRLMSAVALAVLTASVGCRTYCEHRFPCQERAYAPAPTGCAPCAAPAPSAYAPVPVAPVSAQNWGAPRTGCTCTCP